MASVDLSIISSFAYFEVEDTFRSFNEIAAEIGDFQIWSSFLIVLSGLTVSWETLSFAFLARQLPLNCSEPIGVHPCKAECLERNITQEMKAQSILYQWNLICEKSYKQQLAQTILVLGMMIGSVFYGHLADQLGRRPAFLSACMLTLIMGVLVGLSPWYWFFCFTRFFVGIGCGGMAVICIVFMMEYADFSKREFIVVIYRFPYTLGHTLLSPMAYFMGQWRIVQIMTSMFALTFISFFWLMPESPRWLFITGQLERTIAVLRRGLIFNRRPTSKIRSHIERAYDELRMSNFMRAGTMVDLFKKNLCKNTFILTFAWFTLYLLFHGSLDYMTDMTNDVYITVGTSAWITIPSTILAYPLGRYTDRRCSLFFLFGSSAICFFLIPFVPETSIWIFLLSSAVLLLMSITFCIMHLLSAECYPTILRTSAMGLSIFSGNLGYIVAMYIEKMFVNESVNSLVPAFILGSFSLGSAVLPLYLPDTSSSKLLDTIEESETIGKSSAT